MPLTQKDRLMSIKTNLPPNMFGEDALILNGFTGNEGISQLFRFDCDLLGEGDPVEFEDIVGRPATIQLILEGDEVRYFNGYISRFVQLKSERGIHHYRAELVPWLWFLTRSAGCRIFPIPHQQPVPGESEPDDTTKVVKIIERVFKEFGFSDYRFHEDVNSIFDPREFCVQYRETAFNFVSRLMEQYGIFYYFEHEETKHTLVLGNTPNAHQTIGGEVDLYFVSYEPTSQMLDHDAVTHIEFEKNIRPGAFNHRDFNFSMNLTGRHLTYPGETTQFPLGGNEQYEIYDYPAEVLNKGQLEALGKMRMEEEEAQHYRIEGRSTSRLFTSGYSFTLLNYEPDKYNDTYLLTSVQHFGSMGGTYLSEGGGEDDSYFNTFSCIPLTTPFRPIQKTPKPVVQGPQTAIVVGPPDHEIWCDKHGRIKVQFHWDRDGQYDDESSCFVRVSQIWAGKQWGAQFIPRVGHEVIVEFLEGDPDKPIVTGCVYNEENKPPYDLPLNQTQSGIKSRSSKDGTPNNFNEFRFEDKTGSEEVYLQGEKDWNIKIKDCENETVGSNITTNAGGSITRNAGKDISRTADEMINDSAGKDIVTRSTGNMDLKAGGSYQLFTNLGIQLKAMNFLAEIIESGAKEAAAAAAKGGGAKEGAKKAGSEAQSKPKPTKKERVQAAAKAFGPAVAAVTADLNEKQAKAEENMGKAEAGGTALGEAAGKLHEAVSNDASREVIAAAVMALAGAGYETYKDAKRLIEDMLPQIPSIVMWAMKDISATALWSMTLQTKIRDISIEAKNKNIEVKAKRNVNVEAEKEDISLKAAKKNIVVTGKEKVTMKAEDKEMVIEAGKDKLTIKSPKMITIKVKGSIICLTEKGISVKSQKVVVKGTKGPAVVKGKPVKLN